MKKTFAYFLVLFSLVLIACSTDENSDTSNDVRSECGSHNGKQLHTGPEGGCYYINSNGNKNYVDRSECLC